MASLKWISGCLRSETLASDDMFRDDREADDVADFGWQIHDIGCLVYNRREHTRDIV